MPTNSISFLVKLLSISQYSLSSSAMDASSLGSPELQDFINQEKQKAMVNEMIGKLTSACWDKCITGTPGSKFSSCLYSWTMIIKSFDTILNSVEACITYKCRNI
ncbi:hypothetical protein ACS0TY_030336 [Phlomoides rotata]